MLNTHNFVFDKVSPFAVIYRRLFEFVACFSVVRNRWTEHTSFGVDDASPHSTMANIWCHAFDARYLIFDSFVFFALHIKLNNEMWFTLTAHWIWFVDDNHVFVMISTSQWKNFSVQDDDAHELVSLAFSHWIIHSCTLASFFLGVCFRFMFLFSEL